MLAKFESILDGIREKNPGFLMKTVELVNRFSAAALRYEAVLKNVEARRNSLPRPAGGARPVFLSSQALKETRIPGESLLMCIRPSHWTRLMTDREL